VCVLCCEIQKVQMRRKKEPLKSFFKKLEARERTAFCHGDEWRNEWHGSWMVSKSTSIRPIYPVSTLLLPTALSPLHHSARCLRSRIMQANAALSSRKDDKRRHATMNEPVDLASPDCELMAIRQFTCTYVPHISIDCKPLQRLFMV